MKNTIIIALLTLISLGGYSQDVEIKKTQYIDRQTGKPYTGILIEKDQTTGKIISETTIQNGDLNGITTLYFSNGLKKEIREYRHGKKHGKWFTWNESGVKTAQASFSEGVKDGPWIIWDDKGNKRYEMQYRNGKKDGIWTIWDETGKVISRDAF